MNLGSQMFGGEGAEDYILANQSTIERSCGALPRSIIESGTVSVGWTHEL
jgi:hypothetical protein